MSGQWLKAVVNGPNLPEARRIWSLADSDYSPIDWQLDFKSGYRWSAKTWYRDISYGYQLGADVKVPWELARMQHLPQLALAYRLARTGDMGAGEPYRREFRNQVLDFLAANPPRFGVNWNSTVDVALRVANWLVARDLFLASGATFDRLFDELFARAVYEHANHIVNNLELSAGLRANHYLGDVAGLLFAGAWLAPSAETDYWLQYAGREVLREVEGQFLDDGANFEGSTSYHRLSAEMAIYATALICHILREQRPRVVKAARQDLRARRSVRARGRRRGVVRGGRFLMHRASAENR